MRSFPLVALSLLCAVASGVEPAPPLPQRLPVPVEAAEHGEARLGVLVSPMGPVLRHQLGLEQEAGLTVDYVQPGSAAERCGLSRYDLLLKLNDQLLVNADQLQALLALHRNGDAVQLMVFRGGSQQRISVTLASAGAAEAAAAPAAALPAPAAGPDILWQRAPSALAVYGARPGQAGSSAGAQQEPMAVSANGDAGAGDGSWRGFSITVENDNGRHVTVADEKGAIVYDGPYLTPAEQAQVPEQARAVLDNALAHADLLPPGAEGPLPPSSPCVLTLADGLTVMASSTHVSTRAADGEGPPSSLIDGNTGTRWSSAFADHQWVDIDLGSSRALSGLALLWETASAKSYAILGSDDRHNWRSLSASADGAPGPRTDLIDLHGQRARYLRLKLDERATVWGFSLYEVMIFPLAR